MIQRDFIPADMPPDKLKLTVPTKVTVIVETEIQGQIQRSSHPAMFMGSRKKDKWILYSGDTSWSLAPNQRVTHWMVRA